MTGGATDFPPLADPDLMEVVDAGDHIQLRAIECLSCHCYSFPPRSACPQCSSRDVEPAWLGPLGVLRSYTVVLDPTVVEPVSIVVGQVEFSEGPIVRGYLDAAANGPPPLDAAVELVPYVLPEIPGCEEATTFALREVTDHA